MLVWMETRECIFIERGSHEFTKISTTYPFLVAAKMWFPLGSTLMLTTWSTTASCSLLMSSLLLGAEFVFPAKIWQRPSSFEELRSKKRMNPSEYAQIM